MWNFPAYGYISEISTGRGNAEHNLRPLSQEFLRTCDKFKISVKITENRENNVWGVKMVWKLNVSAILDGLFDSGVLYSNIIALKIH